MGRDSGGPYGLIGDVGVGCVKNPILDKCLTTLVCLQWSLISSAAPLSVNHKSISR